MCEACKKQQAENPLSSIEKINHIFYITSISMLQLEIDALKKKLSCL